MIIYPAIDLKDRQCIRLIQGDFKQKQIYNTDPLSQAKEFEALGSKYLHIVDLDGAKDQKQRQSDIIENIASETSLKIQTGGGIRTTEQIEKLLSKGIKRVIIGSLAIKDKNLVSTWLNKFGKERIVLALDINVLSDNIYVATGGWQESSDNSLWSVLDYYKDISKHMLCTDISKDGMLCGSNIDLYTEIKNKYPNYHLQASGGVSSVEEIAELKQANIDGVIIGKALYEGKINLQEGLRIC